MSLYACKDAEELSCVLANLIAETRLPCERCIGTSVPIVEGLTCDGRDITVRILPDNVLDVTGADELLEKIRGRRCFCRG